MAQMTAEQAGGKSVVAFLDMIAYSEGTDNGRQRTRNRGYDVIVGGGLLTDYSDHPRKVVKLSPKLSSSAAGRYQFLRRTWDELASQLGLPDFSPESQDAACIQLLKRRKALDLVKAGRFEDAVKACRKEWASLPGAGYGQHEQKLEKLKEVYMAAGGAFRRVRSSVTSTETIAD